MSVSSGGQEADGGLPGAHILMVSTVGSSRKVQAKFHLAGLGIDPPNSVADCCVTLDKWLNHTESLFL